MGSFVSTSSPIRQNRSTIKLGVSDFLPLLSSTAGSFLLHRIIFFVLGFLASHHLLRARVSAIALQTRCSMFIFQAL
ncbi:hypothetical protein L1987_38510 [Smallanthus sonchifolius]|uniref:Uncharacterized protein n=1 Tax=Smallanthus sonchifolius TaxID=185202 RepID=A0ACB9HKT0_9ASTR|nr:hypothetical protein L1987_38510 [Smallanthus sonchifolius]